MRDVFEDIDSVVGSLCIRLELLDDSGSLQNVGYFVRGKDEWEAFERECPNRTHYQSFHRDWKTIKAHGEEEFNHYKAALLKAGYFGECEFEPM